MLETVDNTQPVEKGQEPTLAWGYSLHMAWVANTEAWNSYESQAGKVLLSLIKVKLRKLLLRSRSALF